MADRTASDTVPATDAPSAGGGAKAFLPLAITVVLMPALAWALTTYVLIPKVQKSLGGTAVAAAEHATEHGTADAHKADAGAHDKGADKGHGAKDASSQSFTLSRLLVNVSGTQGSRYLQASVTLNGAGADFRTKVERNEARLRDMACTALASKTITDLEKPGARNLVRSELLNGFNRILGGTTVEELFITEFAIQ
jgi:flagellar basal body-associated protein FliL